MDTTTVPPPTALPQDEWHARTAGRASMVLRALLGVLSLAAAAVGGLGFVLGVDGLRVAGMLVFCLVGVGAAPWQLKAALSGYERLTLTFITSIGVMTLVPMTMMALDTWASAKAFVAVAVVCLPLHVAGLAQVSQEARSGDGQGWPSPYLPLASTRKDFRESVIDGLPAVAPAVIGAVLCLWAATGHRHLTPGFFGFLPRIGPVWYVGLALVLLSLVLGGKREHSRAVPVVLLVLVLTATPALTYDGPRSQSAAKHIDFVTQIQSFHVLNSSVPAYNAFAGFFAAIAWLCDIAGISDPLRLATAWPALLGVGRVVVLRFLAGQILHRADQRWIAVTLAVLADSIGADYFSPQSVGFVLGMAAIAVAVMPGADWSRLLAVLLAGLTLSMSHQLSPYVVGGVLVVLVAFRLVRRWWVPLLVLVPCVTWAAFHWAAVRTFVTLSSFANATNFRPPKTVAAPGLERLPVVRETVVALVAGILVVGVLASVTLLRHPRNRGCWALACCAGVGLLVIGVNPYGQEGIFRAALFGLPWLAILASRVFSGTGLRARIAMLATSAVLLSTFLVSSFGLDAVNVLRTSDLAAVRTFEHQGGPHPPYPYYLLLLNTGDQPVTPSTIGNDHYVWGRDLLDDPVRQERGFRPRSKMRQLTERFVRYTKAPRTHATLFALWSPAGQEYGLAYGVQSPRQSAELRDAFRATPYWTVVRRAAGTYLFRFEPSYYVGGTR